MAAEDYFAGWEEFAALRTPKIAAVNGYALGGGCELAMMCDFIIAGESAVFGQPEIKLGVIPGIGGTQRLTRLVGKAKAMDLVLTGRTMDAAEAERSGLVSRVVPDDRVLDEATEAAEAIASYGRAAVTAAREAVDRALETGLRDGILFERRVFHALFATEDQSEGMRAFLEKRRPRFTGR
jgi:enoyl-CoA hydratase